MADRTKIEWTRSDDGTPGATWNPVTGCTKLSPASPGCQNCYASTFAERFRGTPGHYFERGFDVQLRYDKLLQPMRWRRPRRIFVNSMSDLFHDQVPDDYIAKVFAIMLLAQRHTFQVLTKRHGRMYSLLNSHAFWTLVLYEALNPELPAGDRDGLQLSLHYLPNVWLGVSTENQKWADIRIPALLDTPAAVRFISAEPLLGPINLRREWGYGPGIDWIIVGGESGPGARPMHPDWARALRDQRNTVGAAFLFKQWGEWGTAAPMDPHGRLDFRGGVVMTDDGNVYQPADLDWPDGPRRGEAHRANFPHHHPTYLYRVGKKRAGRELDGRTWDEYPAGSAAAG
uniref:Methyltransferase n=1 Tax=Mycobacterium phage Farewell TaxID=3158893 RepID=A0AAU8GM25_9CAUD